MVAKSFIFSYFENTQIYRSREDRETEKNERKRVNKKNNWIHNIKLCSASMHILALNTSRFEGSQFNNWK